MQIDPDKPLTNSLEIDVGDKATFSSTKMPLRVLADLLTKDHQGKFKKYFVIFFLNEILYFSYHSRAMERKTHRGGSQFFATDVDDVALVHRQR